MKVYITEAPNQSSSFFLGGGGVEKKYEYPRTYAYIESSSFNLVIVKTSKSLFLTYAPSESSSFLACLPSRAKHIPYARSESSSFYTFVILKTRTA